ncbi:hypothetical protein GCM10009682_56170 [Luedemannella flava]|uniref:DUF4878 domain-containing protein n=1 Tax=Luedemannella flava TaxID=349316 RepID=A0ABP4YT88_9ACTN
MSSPPPYPPQPVWDPNQPQPKKKRSTLKIVIIAIVAVVVLCGGAIGTGIYFIVRAVDDATQPMRDAATGYLDDLKARNYETAYGRLCQRTRGHFSQAEFVSAVSARPVSDYTVTGFNVANRNGLVDGNVTVRWTETDGTSVTHIIPMVQEGDTWRVCGDPD